MLNMFRREGVKLSLRALASSQPNKRFGSDNPQVYWDQFLNAVKGGDVRVVREMTQWSVVRSILEQRDKLKECLDAAKHPKISAHFEAIEEAIENEQISGVKKAPGPWKRP